MTQIKLTYFKNKNNNTIHTEIMKCCVLGEEARGHGTNLVRTGDYVNTLRNQNPVVHVTTFLAEWTVCFV